MRHVDDSQRSTPASSARGSLLLLGFGLAVLAFLVAIGRPHWFEVRPATGTAVAMSHAATPDMKR